MYTDKQDRERILVWLLENTDVVPMEMCSLISDVIRDVEYLEPKVNETLLFGIKWLNRIEGFVEKRKK